MNIASSNLRLILTSGDNVVVFDHNSGDVDSVRIPAPNLPPNLSKGQLEVLNKQERTINSVAVSSDNKHIAVATENKQIVIFDDGLKVAKNFIVNRSASKILFTNDGDVLVADRTGDVYLYKFSEEKSEPVLLLGHLSMILDMALSECGKYIITCDRDEKIRVSHFPNTCNIVSYCLGHDEFVICVKVVQKILLSASGDGTVRIWNYLKGEQLNVINTNEYVSNDNLLKEFSDKMDKEKVDVTALPITDMQVHNDHSSLVVAVSLYSCNAIHIYKIELDTYKWSCLKNIQPVETLHKFYLFNNDLFIFDNVKVHVYKFTNDYSVYEDQKLADFYINYKDILKISDSNYIMVLYKRKYDNVQEYLERKKLRLDTNK